MAKFVTLGNGVLINTCSVSRILPNVDGTGQATIYFIDGSALALTTDDSKALTRQLGLSTAALSSNLKTLIFWIVIVFAVILTWSVIRSVR